jgi:hypothetical protein
MRRYWIVVLMAALLTAAGFVSSAATPASAQEATIKLALVPGGTLDGALAPLAEEATHNLCGIGLGGRCPRGYRACLRTQPRHVCDEWLGRCERCTHEMAECRQKVGHVAGFTCVKCRAAFDKCEAALSVPSK